MYTCDEASTGRKIKSSSTLSPGAIVPVCGVTVSPVVCDVHGTELGAATLAKLHSHAAQAPTWIGVDNEEWDWKASCITQQTLDDTGNTNGLPSKHEWAGLVKHHTRLCSARHTACEGGSPLAVLGSEHSPPKALQ